MDKKQAAERLLSSFSQINYSWVEAVADKIGAEFYPPIWSTMWIVNDPVDRQMIEKLVVTDLDDDSETYGQQVVGDTGIYAQTIDDELILSMNGAGYDFYESHWIPLYDALGYEWHDKEATQ